MRSDGPVSSSYSVTSDLPVLALLAWLCCKHFFQSPSPWPSKCCTAAARGPPSSRCCCAASWRRTGQIVGAPSCALLASALSHRIGGACGAVITSIGVEVGHGSERKAGARSSPLHIVAALFRARAASRRPAASIGGRRLRSSSSSSSQRRTSAFIIKLCQTTHNDIHQLICPPERDT